MTQGTLLAAEGLCFAYPESRQRVIQEISFRVSAAERVALVGPNGSGKTTLFLLLCGILRPAAGTIMIDRKPVVPGTFNPQINYLFQASDDQLFSATVFDDVAFGPLHMSLPVEEVRNRAWSALEAVDCRGLAERAPHHLSGGEKRMVALATILAMRPRIILLDEPTANLDSKNRRRVIRTISGIEQALVIASHDLEFLLETCQQVLLLDQGRLVRQGPIREVLADEALLLAHGLEKPHSLTPHPHG